MNEIVEWKQTNLIEYFERNVQTIDDAIEVGLVLKEVGERCEIAIGQLANHVEKAKAGRGLKGGIRAFSRGVGIPYRTVYGWMKATATEKLVAHATNLGIRKTEEVERAPKPEDVWEWVDEVEEETGKAPTVKEIRKEVKTRKRKKKTKKAATPKPKHPMDYKLICGDCLKELKHIENDSIDVIMTSPPYNLNIPYGKYDDNKDYQKYLQWMREVFKELYRVLSKDGSFFLNVGFSATSPWVSIDVAGVARELFQLQNNIVWIKSITVNGSSYGHFKPINSKRFVNNIFESIYHFTKSGNVILDKLAIGVPYEDKNNITRWKSSQELRCRGNVWFIPYKTITDKAERWDHPASFPSKLPEMCIKLHGIEKTEMVLDPFVGVGNTIVAACKLNISAIGIDIDKEYIESAKERLSGG